jgi:di/tripeptidase
MRLNKTLLLSMVVYLWRLLTSMLMKLDTRNKEMLELRILDLHYKKCIHLEKLMLNQKDKQKVRSNQAIEDHSPKLDLKMDMKRQYQHKQVRRDSQLVNHHQSTPLNQFDKKQMLHLLLDY